MNSLRVRLPQLLVWLSENRPDVVALQETKVRNEEFPSAALESVGYRSEFNGQKTYNGVALLSRAGIAIEDRLADPPELMDPQRRILAGTVWNVRIINLYVPNGSEVGSEKYAYKLEWLKKIADFLSRQLSDWAELIVLGDFNIAPEDRDVYDPMAWREKILCSTAEREAFFRLLHLGFSDAFRLFEQPEESYTWWDYRTAAFRRNQGLRIDHILVSAAMKKRIRACHIDPALRKLERPSDHTPVWADFE